VPEDLIEAEIKKIKETSPQTDLSQVFGKIITNQVVSENFIINHKQEIDWGLVSLNQPMSLKFILNEVPELIHIRMLEANDKIDQEQFEKYKVYDILRSIQGK
jgi:hypothetical protein